MLVAAEQAETLVYLLESRPYLGNHLVPDAPSDYGTFAGEIPWSAGFQAAGDLENGLPPYIGVVSERWADPGIEIELLAHDYAIEASRTVTSLASGHSVPSSRLASALHLRQRPGTLDMVTLDGRVASRTLSGPAQFEGKLLYLRRDLLADYANGRPLVQLAWGERQVDLDWNRRPPKWFEEAGKDYAELWRRINITNL
jgi:hypothetical protein